MTHGKEKDQGWWDRFDQWQEEWEKKRKEKALEDARKLREAEEDYEKSLHTLNPLITATEPKKILATQSREPGLKRLPLKSLTNYHLIMPAEIMKIDQPNNEEATIFFQIDVKNQGKEILEPAAFQIKRIMEYLINERLLFFLQSIEKSAFVIQVAGDKAVPPLVAISQTLPDALHIRVLKKSLQWSPGYIFDVPEMLKQIIHRLNRAIEEQKETGKDALTD